MKKQLLILGLLCYLVLTSTAQKWEKIYPSMEANLSQIKFIDDTTGFIIGANGYIAKTTDRGKSWNQKKIPTVLAIQSIDFVDGSLGYCTDLYNYYRTTDRGEHWTKLSGVGGGPIYFMGNIGFQASRGIARSLDAGQTWTAVPFSNPSSDYMYGISFANKDTGFVVGDFGIMAVTRNNGSTWSKIKSYNNYLYSVAATSSKTAYAVGLGGAILKYVAGDTVTKDTTIQLFNPTAKTLYSICFTNYTTGYAVGDGGCILKTIDEGKTWIPQKSGVVSKLRSVVFLNDTAGFAVGGNGTIIKTLNAGKDWIQQTEFIPNFKSVYMIDSSVAVAVGSLGTIFKTKDNGNTWQKQLSGTTLDLNAVFFTSPSTGYIAADSGVILSTVDSGKVWTKTTRNYVAPLNSIYFINKTKGFIVGGETYRTDTSMVNPPSIILKTEDSGTTWTVVHSDIGQYLKDVFFATADSGFVVGGYKNSSSGPRIYRTTDGGDTWTQSTGGADTYSSLISVQFVNSHHGFAGGESGWFLETKDGGNSWTRITTLGSAGASGDPIYDMYFLNEQKGYATFLSMIWATSDGGLTWKQASTYSTATVTASFRYISISMFNNKTGFAVGTDGNIARYYDTTAVIPVSVKTWPGDTDHDHQVSNDDLLPIGLFYGTTGYPRTQISNTWMGFDSNDWKVSQKNGEDIKHIDCNGDGTINDNDTLAIYLNFSKVHAKPATTDKMAGLNNLAFQADKLVYGPGEWVNVKLVTKSILDLYGLAFDVEYDATLVEPGTETLIYTNSWLNYPVNPPTKVLSFTKVDGAAGQAYGAITRTTKVNAKDLGEVASLRFQIKKNISTLSQMKFSYSHVKGNDAAGNDVLFNRLTDSIKIDPILTSIDKADNVSDFSIYPNPYNTYAIVFYELKAKSSVRLELVDAVGRSLRIITDEMQASGKHQYTIDASESLAEGVYYIKLSVDKNTIMKKVVLLR